MLHAVDLSEASQTRQTAGDQEADHIDPVGIDAAQLRRVAVLAHGANPEAQSSMLEQDVDRDRHHDGQDQAQVDTGTVDDVGQIGRLGNRVGLQIFRLGLLQHGAQQVVSQRSNDVGGHHTDQEFVGIELCLCQTDQRAHGGAGDVSAQHGQSQQQPGGDLVLQRQGDGDRGDGTHAELALSADVEEVCLISKGKCQRGEDQGRCLDHNLTQVILVGDDLAQGLGTDLQGVDAHEQEQACADNQTNQNCSDVIQQCICRFQFQLHYASSFSSATPAISRPICSVVSSPLR